MSALYRPADTLVNASPAGPHYGEVHFLYSFMGSLPITRVAGSLLKLLVPGAFLLTVMAQAANAASPNATVSGAKPSIVERTHGCHYSCECGSLKDFGCEQVYHRHLHMLCLPVRCPGKECDATPSEGVCRHIAPP
jgi:hypothetical protein